MFGLARLSKIDIFPTTSAFRELLVSEVDLYCFLKNLLLTCRLVSEPGYLDIGDSISYEIPLSYEKMAASLNLPSVSDIHVEEFYLKGTLDLRSLVEMMAADKRFGPRSRTGMGDPKPQYESLQARLKAQSANDSAQKFSLKVSDAALQASLIPEGAAGSIRRSILSEGGVLQVYYVKVLEKGETYEVRISFHGGS